MSGEFGQTVDYFGVAGANLVCVSSDDGAARSSVRCAHSGPFEAADFGPVVYSPKCVYEVVGAVDFSASLGQKCAGVAAMLTGVRCETALGAVPRITLSGTANEGAAAINLFPVAFRVSPRHRPQNLMGAMAGDVDALQSCSLSASCTPVVLWEGLEPCASDVTDGIVAVELEVLGGGGEATAGWDIAGRSTSGEGTGYRRSRLTFEKALSVA